VSSKEKISEAERIERLKKKVNRIYENYGIAQGGMDEGDLSAVYRYYLERQDELDSDYKESQLYADKFDDDDLI
jgi:hypothetical protein